MQVLIVLAMQQKKVKKKGDVSYAPSINLLEQLQKSALHQLTNVEKKEEGIEFKIPSIEWVRHQLFPSRDKLTIAATIL